MTPDREKQARRLAERILDLVEAEDAVPGLSGTEKLTAAVAYRRPDFLPSGLGFEDGPRRLDAVQKHAVRLIRGSRTKSGGRGRPRRHDSPAARERYKASRRRAAAKADSEFVALARHDLRDVDPRKLKKADLAKIVADLQMFIEHRDEMEEFGG